MHKATAGAPPPRAALNHLPRLPALHRLQTEINHALTHELVHAYDHCRGKNLDWTNCQHHACSEIRAAALSGGCCLQRGGAIGMV